MSLFSDFDLLPSLQKTLKEKKLTKPTEIQALALPLFLNKKSIVALSETGSGKTLAYALPILHQLKSLELQGQSVNVASTPRALVLAPTRELGEQISKVFKGLTHDTRLRVRTALGGEAFEQTLRNIQNEFEVLLATPGRLGQLLERKMIHLEDVRIVIFDEADQMVDEGFLPDSKRISSACTNAKQWGLFSATIPKKVQTLIDTLFKGVQVVQSQSSHHTVASLNTRNCQVTDGNRWPVFEKILSEPIKSDLKSDSVKGGTLVFTNTREQCDKLAKVLEQNNIPCAIYRGDMEKNKRRTNLKKFRLGQIDLLVTTELGSRGLDIERVDRVVNYFLPKNLDNYLHRVGRTARAGRGGTVYNLITERDEWLIAEIESLKPQQNKRVKRG